MVKRDINRPSIGKLHTMHKAIALIIVAIILYADKIYEDEARTLFARHVRKELLVCECLSI